MVFSNADEPKILEQIADERGMSAAPKLSAFERAVVAEYQRRRRVSGLADIGRREDWQWLIMPLPDSPLRQWFETSWQAAKDDAATLNVSSADIDDKASAWRHLHEFAQDRRLKPGPPPSIRATTSADALQEIDEFMEADIVDAVADELLSGRLEKLDHASPWLTLRGNVLRQAHRHYVDGLIARRERARVEVELDLADECPTRWKFEDDVAARLDLEIGLKHLSEAGLPGDAAALLRCRFDSSCHLRGIDADVGRTLGWGKHRLEAAQAALRIDRWGGAVRRWFMDGGYVPFDPRSHRGFKQKHGYLPWEDPTEKS